MRSILLSFLVVLFLAIAVEAKEYERYEVCNLEETVCQTYWSDGIKGSEDNVMDWVWKDEQGCIVLKYGERYNGDWVNKKLRFCDYILRKW